MPDFSTLPALTAADMAATTETLAVKAGVPSGGRTRLDALAELILGVGCGPLAGNAGKLVDGSAVLSIDWLNRQLNAPDGSLVLDWFRRVIYNPAGQSVADFTNGCRLYDAYGVDSCDTHNRIAYDTSGVASLDWGQRTLNAAGGSVTTSWSNGADTWYGCFNGGTVTIGDTSNASATINMLGGVIRMPAIPDTDPADGLSGLWYDPITRVIKLGT